MSKKKQHGHSCSPKEPQKEQTEKEEGCCQKEDKQECGEETVDTKLQNEELEKAKKDNEELKEQYLRAYADFENVKKRLVREKDQALEYAYEKIAKDLLPSIDTLEVALKSIEESSNSQEVLDKMKEGISLTLDNLLKVLSKHGIDVITEQSEFDPNIHDAIMHVESADKESGEIVATMQKGYRYKDRVLRPALVSVAK